MSIFLSFIVSHNLGTLLVLYWLWCVLKIIGADVSWTENSTRNVFGIVIHPNQAMALLHALLFLKFLFDILIHLIELNSPRATINWPPNISFRTKPIETFIKWFPTIAPILWLLGRNRAGYLLLHFDSIYRIPRIPHIRHRRGVARVRVCRVVDKAFLKLSHTVILILPLIWSRVARLKVTSQIVHRKPWTVLGETVNVRFFNVTLLCAHFFWETLLPSGVSRLDI
jgi:hypothetical protein